MSSSGKNSSFFLFIYQLSIRLICSLGTGTGPVYEHDGGVIAVILIATISFFFTCLVNALASTGSNSK